MYNYGFVKPNTINNATIIKICWEQSGSVTSRRCGGGGGGATAAAALNS